MNSVAQLPAFNPLVDAQLAIINEPELIQEAIELAHEAADRQRTTSQHCDLQLEVDAFWQSISSALIVNTTDQADCARALKALQARFNTISHHLAHQIKEDV